MVEKKRKRKREAENAKYDEHLRTCRLLARCVEIINMVAPTDFIHLDCAKMQKEKCLTFVISNADLFSAMLKPRYHANALIYLIPNGDFIGRAEENAIVKEIIFKRSRLPQQKKTRQKAFLLIKRKQNVIDKRNSYIVF